MALMTCSECGRKVSYKADKCPQCGCSLVQKTLFGALIKSILKFSNLILLVGGFLGLYSAYTSIFVPIISVTQTASLDSADPFATQFIISNEGPTEVDVTTIDGFDQEIKTVHNNSFTDNHLINNFNITLLPGEKMTIPFPFRQFIGLSKSDVITNADIVFAVDFKSTTFPWGTYRRNFRFVTQQSSDGTLLWFPQPFQD